jgi:hypothetical protein
MDTTLNMSLYNRILTRHFEVDMHYPNRKSYNAGDMGKEQYGKACNEYRRQEREKLEEFKKLAIYDVGLEDHPNADHIYSYAWQEGHASGLYEVYQILSEISKLFFKDGKMLGYTKNDMESAMYHTRNLYVREED